jgi:tight adherence protein B
MDLIGALAVVGAVAALSLAVLASPGSRSLPIHAWITEQAARRRLELEHARLPADPRAYLALTLAAPPVAGAVGWWHSPILGVFGLLGGFFLPRLYLRFLVNSQTGRSEREAPRLLQVLLASLNAGGTYLEVLRAARKACRDRWIREDLDFVIQQFLLGVPLGESIAAVRRRTRSPNLALIWDNLAICVGNQLPTQKAKILLLEISSTLQFNVQLASEVRARTSGQRAQIWLLALVVPALFFYLRLLNPDFLEVLDTTALGRYVLVPAAVFLEVLGIVLSFRLVRVRV